VSVENSLPQLEGSKLDMSRQVPRVKVQAIIATEPSRVDVNVANAAASFHYGMRARNEARQRTETDDEADRCGITRCRIPELVP